MRFATEKYICLIEGQAAGRRMMNKIIQIRFLLKKLTRAKIKNIRIRTAKGRR